ncbi:hypothetical protein PVAP13_4KG141305 [Panicum virgatum]|uniref:Alpha/beta hydrolase fold-3 domain-containing protein n=1 Tax=Panicum virgatum TaxID=38727 RepID=A0A8T0THA3_PANVG|nr:hypothetical protein PVAP13_4KG141305 [Panicum virgatum]
MNRYLYRYFWGGRKACFLVVPAAADGADDLRMNPLALPSASGLRKMPGGGCWCARRRKTWGRRGAGPTKRRSRRAGGGGAAEWFESEGEEHVFFLAKPASDRAVAALMDRVVAFFTASDATDGD